MGSNAFDCLYFFFIRAYQRRGRAFDWSATGNTVFRWACCIHLPAMHKQMCAGKCNPVAWMVLFIMLTIHWMDWLRERRYAIVAKWRSGDLLQNPTPNEVNTSRLYSFDEYKDCDFMDVAYSGFVCREMIISERGWEQEQLCRVYWFVDIDPLFRLVPSANHCYYNEIKLIVLNWIFHVTFSHFNCVWVCQISRNFTEFCWKK